MSFGYDVSKSELFDELKKANARAERAEATANMRHGQIQALRRQVDELDRIGREQFARWGKAEATLARVRELHEEWATADQRRSCYELWKALGYALSPAVVSDDD